MLQKWLHDLLSAFLLSLLMLVIFIALLYINTSTISFRYMGF